MMAERKTVEHANQTQSAIDELNLKKKEQEVAESSEVGSKMAEDSGRKEELETETEDRVKDVADDTDNATQSLRKGKSKLEQNDQKEELEKLTEDLMKDVEDDQEDIELENPVVGESSQASREENVSVELLKRIGLDSDRLPIQTILLVSLLEKLPCTSVSEDRDVMMKIRLLTKESNYARCLFGQITYPIKKVLNPTSIERSRSDVTLQALMAAILFGICRKGENWTYIVQECSETVPFLVACLRTKARRSAAAALSKLVVPTSNRQIIGESDVIKAAIDIIKEGDSYDITFACMIIWYLCSRNDENRERAVSEGVVVAVMNSIRKRIRVDEMLKILELLSQDENVVAKLEANGALRCLLTILREDFDEKIKERCVIVIHTMCRGSVEKMRKINEVKKGRQTLKCVASTGSTTAREKANELLSGMDTKNRRR